MFDASQWNIRILGAKYGKRFGKMIEIYLELIYGKLIGYFLYRYLYLLFDLCKYNLLVLLDFYDNLCFF